MLSRFVSFLLNFQLTTSQGGRPVLALTVDLCCALSTHDLTRRSTVVIPTQLIIGISFNSRPHKEVDFEEVHITIAGVHLSTHDLTRRSTCRSRNNPKKEDLSTHDLTRRSTIWLHDCDRVTIPFNSRPHKEVDLL